MICDTDEFLLVAQKWLTDSATVTLSFMLFENPKEPILVLRLRGRISSVDASLPGFCFLTGEDSITVVALHDWKEMGYLDRGAFPPTENIEESLTVARPGASVNLSILKEDE
jgi:hypothetical protein